MGRILPSLESMPSPRHPAPGGDSPSGPVRRSRTAAGKLQPRRASWLDELDSPSPPPRARARRPRTSRPLDDAADEDDATRPLLASPRRGSPTSRGVSEPEDDASLEPSPASCVARDDASDDSNAASESDALEEEERLALEGFARLLRLACVVPPRDLRVAGDVLLFVPAAALGFVLPALAFFYRRRRFRDEETNDASPAETRSEVFSALAASVAWYVLQLRHCARKDGRDVLFFVPPGGTPIFPDPDVREFRRSGASGEATRARRLLRARALYARLVRRRAAAETGMFLAPFFAVRVAVAAWHLCSPCPPWHLTVRSVSRSSFTAALALEAVSVASETYRAAVFLVASASYRLACALLLLRLEAFLTLFETLGDARNNSWNDRSAAYAAAATLEEHARLHDLSRRLSHRHRLFLVLTALLAFAETARSAYDGAAACLGVPGSGMRGATVAIVASGAALRAVSAGLNVRAATLITHRMQRVVGFASRRHAELAAAEAARGDDPGPGPGPGPGGAAGTTRIDRARFARGAALGVLRDAPLGVRVFGFACDRDLFRGLHMVAFATAIFIATRALDATNETDGG
jgi:hypothetical protein